jgi:fluoroacetyl-CoA thioesterase
MKQRAGSKKRHSRKSSSAEPKAARASSSPAKTSESSQSSEELRPRIGLESAVEKIIPHSWTIASYDPRLPAVLSTPAMIGMMEIASVQAVLAELPPGAITVGTRIEVDHLKAVPEGTAVRATARLVKHKGRFLVFEVEAKAGEHVIGRGNVYRAIVEPQSFRAKAETRAS